MFARDITAVKYCIVARRYRERDTGDKRLILLCHPNDHWGLLDAVGHSEKREEVTRRQLCTDCRKLAEVGQVAMEMVSA
jgi:hypothetical protein